MSRKQDYFISHAGADKPRYIEPLARALDEREVTYWLDNREVTWGDSVALSINAGLRMSRNVLLCLSRAFLDGSWPETEMNAALAARTNRGQIKVLPLILNGKRLILEHYPLLAGLAYREYSEGLDKIADDLRSLALASGTPDTEENIRIRIESVHTGKLSNLRVPTRARIKWLSDHARQGVGLKDSLDTGGFQPFLIRWVLVDAHVENFWNNLEDRERDKAWAIVSDKKSPRISRSGRDKLADIGIYDGIVFHLHAVQRHDYGSHDSSYSGGGGGGAIYFPS